MLRSSLQEHKFLENTAYTTFTASSCGLLKRCKVSTQKTKITNSFYFKATSSCVLQARFASHAAEDLQMFPPQVCQHLESGSVPFTWLMFGWCGVLFFFFLFPFF